MADPELTRQQIDAVLARALDRPAAERTAFLERVCAEDRDLFDAVLRLLGYAEVPDAALDTGGGLSGAMWAELAASAAEEALPPAEIGAYRIVREIGRGGMAVVYLAERKGGDFEHRVAIKVVHGGMASVAVLSRFSQERKILASLNHPAIAKLLDGGSTADGHPYFAMELVEGDPIDHYCDRQQLSLSGRLKLFLGVAEAVQYAHRNLVVHRDLKPSNIMVTHDRQVKLLDFGIAKLLDPAAQERSFTAVSALPMTPQCASPEQIRGESITTATDIYQLGLLLYQLLTGRYPYRVDASDRGSLAKAICEQEPTRPSTVVSGEHAAEGSKSQASFERQMGQRLKGDLDSIALMALRKEPDRRYASVEQFAQDIRAYLDGRPVSARADTLAYRSGKFVRRHRFGLGATVVVVVTLIVGIVATLHQAQRAERRFQEVRQLANTFMFEFHDKIQYLSGATEARGLLVDTALKYLDSLAREAGGDRTLLAELAVAYQRVGDVQGNPRGSSLGLTAEAMKSYRKSLEIAESLGADQHDPVVLRALATGYFKVGDMVSEGGATGDGIDLLNKSLAHAESLVAKTNVESDLILLINIVARTGDAELLRRDVAAAQSNYRRVLELAALRAAGYPGDGAEMGVAMSHITLGGALAQAGHLEAAFDNYSQAIDMIERLVAKLPANAFFRRELRLVYSWMGNLLGGPASINRGEADAALQYHRKALAIAEELQAADPASGYARHDLAVSYERVGSALLQIDPQQSAAFHERALALADELLESSPEEFRFARLRAVNLRKLALALAAAGDPESAEKLLRETLDIVLALKERHPANRELEPDMHAAYLALADTQLMSGRSDEALAQYREALHIAEASYSAVPSDLLALWRQATTCERLGDFYAGRAAAGNEPRENWLEARAWYERSAKTWSEWQRFGVSSVFNTRHESRAVEAGLRSERALAAL
ncbi:MAG: protein kinase [Woeseia sp.]